MIKATRISVNFDLKIEKLIKFYPKKSYTSAYYDIKNFMLNHGFEHQQGSGYVSLKPLSTPKFLKIMYEMSMKMPWLHKTARISKATHVFEESFDLDKVLKLPYKNKNKQNKITQQKKPKPKLVPKVKDPKTKTNNLSR